jgi:hypothetical protein
MPKHRHLARKEPDQAVPRGRETSQADVRPTRLTTILRSGNMSTRYLFIHRAHDGCDSRAATLTPESYTTTWDTTGDDGTSPVVRP